MPFPIAPYGFKEVQRDKSAQCVIDAKAILHFVMKQLQIAGTRLTTGFELTTCT
jgi:hypothetical protein